MRSIYIFKLKSTLRRIILQIVLSNIFEGFLIVIILMNSLCLAIYDYEDRDNLTKYNQVISYFGTCFNAIFIMECALKIVAFGFILEKNSYLRDGWNFLDFIVVLSAILEFLPINANTRSLQGIRALRAFRPLRGINSIPSMKKLVKILLISLPNLANVVILLFFIILLFAILGLH